MTSQDLLADLREIECLRGVDEEDLEQLAGFGRHVEFADDTLIFREGDAAEKSYLIVAGHVSLEICAPGIGCRRISTLGDGELLGWSPVIEHDHLSATARTVTPTTMVELPKDRVLALCQQSPRFGYLFMKGVAQTLARRLSAARMQLLDIFGHEAEAAAEQQA